MSQYVVFVSEVRSGSMWAPPWPDSGKDQCGRVLRGEGRVCPEGLYAGVHTPNPARRLTTYITKSCTHLNVNEHAWALFDIALVLLMVRCTD